MGGNAPDSPVAPNLLADLKGARYLLADKGYDAERYKSRHLIENAFCRLKDFRRGATRYDKLARNFLSTVALATLVAFWL